MIITLELTEAEVEELESCIGGSANSSLQRNDKCVLFRLVREASRQMGLPAPLTMAELEDKWRREDER